MEEIYPTENFVTSIHFPLKRYFEEFTSLVPPKLEEIEEEENEKVEEELKLMMDIQSLMGNTISLAELKQLDVACCLDLLKCDGENTLDFPMNITKNLTAGTKMPKSFIIASQTTTLEVNTCRIELEKKKSIVELSLGNKRLYHKNLEFVTPLFEPPDLRPNDDFVISILVYKPVAFKYFTARNASEKLRFNHEILALGRNTLTEVRDTIICAADGGVSEEVQDTTEDLRPFADAKGKYPSGFLFIDNVFYNDLRAPNHIDYSFPIKEWSKKKLTKELKTSQMENVQLKDLTPRFGYPYLYMHQGECEHLFVFSDARLLQSGDCLYSQCYPHVSKLNRTFNKMCFLCAVSFAKWIIVDSDRFPQRKVFLCTDCCNSYNYINGEKVGEFRLYPYYEKHVDVGDPSLI